MDPKALEQALCFKYRRVVAKDHTVSFEGSILQIPKRSPFLSWAGKAVHVHVLLDGSVEIYYKTDRIARFDSKTDCTIGLYRKNGKREVLAMDLKPLPPWFLMDCHPDIFTLLLA